MRLYTRSPLRLGLIGGGTDLDSFCSRQKGHVINCTISLYNHVYFSHEKTSDFSLKVKNEDEGIEFEIKNLESLKSIDPFVIFVPAALRFLKEQFSLKLKGKFDIILKSDVLSGSGLGGSSSMMVAIVSTFNHFFNLKRTKHEIAEISFEIERKILKIEGGSQDFYASSFGGFNFMQFKKNNIVLINNFTNEIIDKSLFESSLLLFYTGLRRESKIIEREKLELIGNDNVFKSMCKLSEISRNSLEYLTSGDIRTFGSLIKKSWELKKKSSSRVSNNLIDTIFEIGNQQGIYGGKISGAGSGGYGFFLAHPFNKNIIIKSLEKIGIEFIKIKIELEGVTTLKV